MIFLGKSYFSGLLFLGLILFNFVIGPVGGIGVRKIIFEF